MPASCRVLLAMNRQRILMWLFLAVGAVILIAGLADMLKGALH